MQKVYQKECRIKYLQYRVEEHLKEIQNRILPELQEEVNELQRYLDVFHNNQAQEYVFNNIMSCIGSIKEGGEDFAEQYNEVIKYDYTINTLKITSEK